VVDDEPGTIDVLMAVLTDSEYRVTGAANGREALARVAHAPPDVMLLDVMMPVLDGVATLRALKADPRFEPIKVVMMSGIPESMVKRRCRGYDAFLRKPFSLDDLLATLQRLL
jgi:two-component system response regulator MprA